MRAYAHWLPAAVTGNDMRYFSVYEGTQLVGQVYLHDIDWQSGEALIGYDLFEPRFRGRGIGTHALTLLQQYAAASTSLTSLIIITVEDNHASRRIAEKCGFVPTGAARENLRWIVWRWDVRRPLALRHRDLENDAL